MAEYAPSRWQTPITQLFIDGEFVDAKNGATFDSINPVDETVIATFQAADAADVDAAVDAAEAAFHVDSPWRKMVRLAFFRVCPAVPHHVLTVCDVRWVAIAAI